MDRTKLRPADWVAGIGGLLVLISLLFLKWYSFGADIEVPFGGGSFSASIGAWDGQGFLGTIANLVILAAGVVAVGLAVVKLTSSSLSLPVAASALTAAGGFAATAFIVLRIVFRPGSGSDLEFGIILALIGAVAQAVGGWKAMKEEGTSFSEAREQLGQTMGSGGPSGGGAPPPPGGGPPPPPSGEQSPPPPPGGDS